MGEGEGGTNWEEVALKYILYYVWNRELVEAAIQQGAQPGALWWPTGLEWRVGWDEGLGEREAQEGQDICIFMADSHCCTEEINTKF